ncbi:maleylpyruvate isomerase N-terminal domain-containing protein [Flavobacterium phragmitis]|uniref:Mycothiol maleylpyruvate isomerase N-terminal domain-containing protein n=1 Tax=Flavobacterium phragmitis TaxID=739143 RepID=A0A1I1LUG1_9FLAO|nr:maleylpyruvate isomerase N-terminal domain-containing protein [Flavobacterium phragmitis]SFC76897.1 Mycothiol maleylpyruvate isomerase N-terminal domain-containing protein [Flavobacterium phragmitis]
MKSSKIIPIQTLHLFPILDTLLIDLLKSLTEEEWNAQTVAKKWKVKDIASHLLDGNLRGLSISRDRYFGENPENINSYPDLVDFLNQLNMTWTNATKRLSPTVLISLLESTGKEYSEHLQILDPFENAIFSVAWAGQETSLNWFHIAREYTEKFLHQQQIRDAVGKQGLMTKELFHPFIETFIQALPHTYRNTKAPVNSVVTLIVTTEIGGQWSIIKKENNWEFIDSFQDNSASTVKINPQDAWLLFSKGMSPIEALEKVEITGDKDLGRVALNIIAVMA